MRFRVVLLFFFIKMLNPVNYSALVSFATTSSCVTRTCTKRVTGAGATVTVELQVDLSTTGPVVADELKAAIDSKALSDSLVCLCKENTECS